MVKWMKGRDKLQMDSPVLMGRTEGWDTTS